MMNVRPCFVQQDCADCHNGCEQEVEHKGAIEGAWAYGQEHAIKGEMHEGEWPDEYGHYVDLDADLP